MLAPMSQAVTLPVFGSANAAAHADGAQSANQAEWQMESGSGDGMDFDLLAEYLLDDNPAGPQAGISFDFNADSSGNASTVVHPLVHPGQNVNGGGRAPAAVADNGVAQAQQIITQHAVGMNQQHHVQRHAVHQQPQLVMAPMPAPAPLAPAPHASHPPVLAAQGIPVQPLPPVPAPVMYAPPATHIAPAPAVAVAVHGGIHHGVAQQPNIAVTKRRRLDVPLMTMSGAPSSVPMMADPMAVAAALQGRGRKKTQAQIDRRRERNRILARRTRLRKKFFFESLQKEVVDLQRENQALKDIVRSELEEEGRALLDECDANEKLPQAVLEACGEHTDMDQQDFNLVRSIQQSQHSFIITDPSLQDNPIVFASDDFLNVTGYQREDVLGRNCRFLQGTETSEQKVQEIRKGLATGDDVTVTLVNYTEDGTPFWNKLFIAALRDAQSNIVNFIAVIAKVVGPDPGDPEHGKILPGENPVDLDDDDDDKWNDDDDQDLDTAAMVADGTVKAIEGVVDAAVAAAPSVVHG